MLEKVAIISLVSNVDPALCGVVHQLWCKYSTRLFKSTGSFGFDQLIEVNQMALNFKQLLETQKNTDSFEMQSDVRSETEKLKNVDKVLIIVHGDSREETSDKCLYKENKNDLYAIPLLTDKQLANFITVLLKERRKLVEKKLKIRLLMCYGAQPRPLIGDPAEYYLNPQEQKNAQAIQNSFAFKFFAEIKQIIPQLDMIMDVGFDVMQVSDTWTITVRTMNDEFIRKFGIVRFFKNSQTGEISFELKHPENYPQVHKQ